MNRRQVTLVLRRQELVAQSAMQRRSIMANVQPLYTKAAAADRILTWAREHPLVTGLAVAAVVLGTSRRVFDVAARLATLYMLIRRR